MGLFDRLKRGLEKTKQILRTDIRDLFRSGEILDEKLLGDFESRLIRTDMGVTAAGRIISRLRQDHGGRTVDVEAIWKTVREELTALLRGRTTFAGTFPIRSHRSRGLLPVRLSFWWPE
ncbi:MAG UNVERIFIED_CONTAM: signal recognition particle receptor subunit alpha [Planctomycetaceae bacterium]|jgi:fused signal recognition particle receptor